jgi:hypothetical protein
MAVRRLMALAVVAVLIACGPNRPTKITAMRIIGQSSVLGNAANFSTMLSASKSAYRLSGRVTELRLGVPFATVSVISGTETGLTSTTSADGQFNILGVAGHITVQVSKAGYATVTQPLDVTADRFISIALTPNVARPNLTGIYTLAITIDPRCLTSGLESVQGGARARTYVATVQQSSRSFDVTLSGATFLSKREPTSFSGRVSPTGIEFEIGLDYYYEPDLIEVLPSGALMTIAGQGSLQQSGSDFVGTLNGVFSVTSSAETPAGHCFQTAHRIVFMRQSATVSRPWR